MGQCRWGSLLLSVLPLRPEKLLVRALDMNVVFYSWVDLEKINVGREGHGRLEKMGLDLSKC